MRSLGLALSIASIGAVLLVTACSGSTNSNGFNDTTGNGNGNGGGPGGGGLIGGGGGDGGTGGGGGGMNGQVDKTASCDTGLATDGDATAFAKSMGICTNAMTDGYGLVSASMSKGWGVSGAPHAAQWGLLPKFGNVIKPREGALLGVLSSGYGREYDDSSGSPGTNFVDGKALYNSQSQAAGKVPPGFPKAAKGCKQDGTVNDMIVVKLTLTAPKDANGFQFDFNFYSSEWPNYVCSNFNDAFIAYLTSTKVPGDNISFDSNNNPVAVNNNFLNRCTPNTEVGCASNGLGGKGTGTAMCAGGESELKGTGFGDTDVTACFTTMASATVGGATGWLTTQAPINPGETFTLELMIFDAGDEVLDSSVLLDNFQWIGGNVSTGTSRVN